MQFDYIYLTLGAGVQSSALLYLAETDPEIPTPDVAIFADTGDEPAWVYRQVEDLKRRSRIPIHVERKHATSLCQDVIARHNGTPLASVGNISQPTDSWVSNQQCPSTSARTRRQSSCESATRVSRRLRPTIPARPCCNRSRSRSRRGCDEAHHGKRLLYSVGITQLEVGVGSVV